jgi:hypothetical protein
MFETGDLAPMNEKAINSPIALCTDCGKKLGSNPFYFEVNTSWELIKPNTKDNSSQGCFPVGKTCAFKFDPELLVRLGA